jgi:hypothetical protein
LPVDPHAGGQGRGSQWDQLTEFVAGQFGVLDDLSGGGEPAQLAEQVPRLSRVLEDRGDGGVDRWRRHPVPGEDVERVEALVVERQVRVHRAGPAGPPAVGGEPGEERPQAGVDGRGDVQRRGGVEQ